MDPVKRLSKSIRRQLWQRRLARLPLSADGKRLLHVGCGPINSPEFINLDARPMAHVHIVTKDIFTLHVIPDASLDMVYMSHVLEHVSHSRTHQTLGEMARVLKVGGTLRISVPDFDHIVSIYECSGRNITSIVKPLMGGQDYPFNFHFNVFNERSLTQLLEVCGFTHVRQWDPRNCNHHDFDDWASREVEHLGRKFPISLNLEASRGPE